MLRAWSDLYQNPPTSGSDMEVLHPLQHPQAQTTGDGMEMLHPLQHPQAQTTGSGMEMLHPLQHPQAQTTGDGMEVLHPLLHPQAQTTEDVMEVLNLQRQQNQPTGNGGALYSQRQPGDVMALNPPHQEAQTTGDVTGAPGSCIPPGRKPQRKPQLSQLPQQQQLPQPQRSRVRLHPGASGHMFPKTQTIAKNTTTESRRVRPSCRRGCAAAANAADGAAMKKTRKRKKIWRIAVWIHL